MVLSPMVLNSMVPGLRRPASRGCRAVRCRAAQPPAPPVAASAAQCRL